jgi:DNA-binding transcriptional LysR family regulator
MGGESWLLGDFGADSPSSRMIDRRCRDLGFHPKVAHRINDCQMAQALVAAGEGIALLPRLMLRPANPVVGIRPLATDPPMRRVSALRLSTRYRTPATERFIALLVAASSHYASTWLEGA